MQEKILKMIEQADGLEINEMLQAMIRRNDRLFPENETICMSLPKNDSNERRRILECVMKRMLEEDFYGTGKTEICEIHEIDEKTL